MSFLLDTNVWIDCLKNPIGNNAIKLQTKKKSEIVTCSIVRAELMHGAQKYGNKQRRISLVEKTLAPFDSYEFDDYDADVYAVVRDGLQRAGAVIGPYDLQIAAIALRRQLTVVTNNVGEFVRVPGLSVEDWSI